MRPNIAAAVLSLALTSPAVAHQPVRHGNLVDVTVDVGGQSAPLYAATDGSGRMYLEARAGADYTIRLQNRTGERVGVQLVVDGLNVISGQRDTLAAPDRMYVLDPWGGAAISGWRTSLQEIRRFTFVDEKRSYAARAGKANGRMGWIEAVVYREDRPVALRQPAPYEEEGRAERSDAPPTSVPSAPAARDQSKRSQESAAGSFPGTGWGDRARDEVALVEFDPQSTPAQRIVLRYEYAGALRALGLLPRRDRLAERESGSQGFAPPPAW